VVTDAADPGWQARIDGASTPVLTANIAFRAVAVPAGRHRIEMRYRPKALTLGLLVTGASLGLALAFLAPRPSASRSAAAPAAHGEDGRE
jgi:uncharacterized membrane protein YfhO